MKRRQFFVIAIIVASLFWLLKSLIYRYFFAEAEFQLLPTDANEFWMRVTIFLLIISVGVLADSRAARIDAVEKEKREIFDATVSSSQHVVNNLLNQVQVLFLDLDNDNKLSDEGREHLEDSIREGKDQIARLSSVTAIDKASIRDSVR